MEKHYLNITKIADIETLWHSGWLISDKKNTEIVLQVDEETYKANALLYLKVVYATLSEGILNSDTSLKEQKHDIDPSKVEIYDFKGLTTELSKTTGLRFSVDVIK